MNKVQFGVVSDTHLCATIQQLGLVNEVYNRAYKKGIKIMLHCGDILDGDYTDVRPIHNYSIFKRGFDEQVDYLIDMYPKVNGIRTYLIAGNHDITHYKKAGATPGYWFAKFRDDINYLQSSDNTINLNKMKIRMQHPGGGSARSLSYKIQVAIDEMESNDKPNIFLQGHYHKGYSCFYRNVHAALVPSLVDQSEFMKINNLQNMVGAYFFTAYIDNQGHIEYLDIEPFNYNKNDLDPNDYKRVKKLLIK